MQAQLHDFVPVNPVAAGTRQKSLDSMARWTAAECERMFVDAEPFPFDSLVGHPRGRVLAIPGKDRGTRGAVMRALHASPAWIWQGKSFAALPGAVEGVGINRVRWYWRRALFPFRTYPTASVVDGNPCFAIDYDIPQNPPRVRRIYDEVRRVDHGLYLGRGMARTSKPTPRLVLWFALDANTQDAPVEFDG